MHSLFFCEGAGLFTEHKYLFFHTDFTLFNMYTLLFIVRCWKKFTFSSCREKLSPTYKIGRSPSI